MKSSYARPTGKDGMPRKRNRKRHPLYAVDLFAGGGGLTVGLKRAGFVVVAAVEVEGHAYSTYKSNHPEVFAYKQDIRTIDGENLLRHSPTGKIDLLAGCPPCQGFTSLTRKYRRNDPRNELIREMARIVRETAPQVVMMENVPGLIDRGRLLFEEFVDELSAIGYVCEWKVLQAADYGVPQNRRRLVFLAGKGFKIPLPVATHSRNGNSGLKAWRTLRDVIGHMAEPVRLSEALSKGGAQSFHWHVVRDMNSQNIRRLRYVKPGLGRNRLPIDLRPDCHKSCDDGFRNVYGRMVWDAISPTITGGCTTLSKGRFGHPEKVRTISVREAALIQGFPSDYIIDTPCMGPACDIVGNALPCDFAEAIARQCADILVAPA